MAPSQPPPSTGLGAEHILPRGREGLEKTTFTEQGPIEQGMGELNLGERPRDIPPGGGNGSRRFCTFRWFRVKILHIRCRNSQICSVLTFTRFSIFWFKTRKANEVQNITEFLVESGTKSVSLKLGTKFLKCGTSFLAQNLLNLAQNSQIWHNIS
jgi:hypothetical protein